jgi:hypothetical protein
VLNEVDNFAHKKNNKEKQCRFSPAVLRLCMNLYNKSPAAYAEFREQSIFSIPSESTMKKRRQANRLEEGFNPIIYCRHAEQRTNVDEIEHGHIGCDEMHLKAGLWWNSANHDLCGFEGNCKDFDGEVWDLLLSSTRPVTKLATKVNQYKFRSVTGKTFNCEYFYNPGALTGKTTVKQCLMVIKSLEAINCRVYGITTDAGGSNAKLFQLLREGLLAENVWLSDDMLSFVNPCDPSRRIWLWHCTTHLLKALRNQLLASSPSGAKAFKDEDGTGFGWGGVLAAYFRDQLLASAKTNLKEPAAFPDSHSKMNVHYAKAPFTLKTLSEMVSYIQFQLGYGTPLFFPAPKDVLLPTYCTRKPRGRETEARILAQ